MTKKPTADRIDAMRMPIVFQCLPVLAKCQASIQSLPTLWEPSRIRLLMQRRPLKAALIIYWMKEMPNECR